VQVTSSAPHLITELYHQPRHNSQYKSSSSLQACFFAAPFNQPFAELDSALMHVLHTRAAAATHCYPAVEVSTHCIIHDGVFTALEMLIVHNYLSQLS
jgi:hypothetical protein